MNADNFSETRKLVANYLCSLESPVGAEAVFKELRSTADEFLQCPCPACQSLMKFSMETIVVLEEILKMVPEDSSAGVASLVHKLWKSTASELPDAMAKALRFARVTNKLKGDLEGVDDEHLSTALTAAVPIQLEGEEAEEFGKVIRKALEKMTEREEVAG